MLMLFKNVNNDKKMNRLRSQTCTNCEKKLMTATMQNRTQIPLICSLCVFTSLMAKVCKYTRFSNNVAHESKQISSGELCLPHPEDLAEQDRVDGIDGAVNSGTQRSQQHVWPLGPVVPEDASHRGRFHMFIWFLLLLLVHLSEVERV